MKKNYKDKPDKPKPERAELTTFERELRNRWLKENPDFLYDPHDKTWLAVDFFGHWYPANAYAKRLLDQTGRDIIEELRFKDDAQARRASNQIEHAHIIDRVLSYAQAWRNTHERLGSEVFNNEWQNSELYGILAGYPPPIQFDADPYLLGVHSGVVDLRTRELRTATPEEFIRKHLDFNPRKGFSDVFNSVVLHAAGVRDKEKDTSAFEVVYWLQTFFGYCLTGATKEHVLLFIVGPKGTGKSTIGECLLRVLGSYATNVESQRFISSRNEVHSQWLARLMNIRLIVVSEMKPNATWDTTKLNRLVDGSSITANRMHHNDETFQSQTKAIFYANYEPKFHADDGIGRRIRVLPMNNKPPTIDKDLAEKLHEDREVILYELIEFAQRWILDGLPPPPPAMANATEKYQREQDNVKTFMEECVTHARGNDLPLLNIHKTYKTWCSDNDIPMSLQLGRQHFKNRLEVLEYHTYKPARLGLHVSDVRMIDDLNME